MQMDRIEPVQRALTRFAVSRLVGERYASLPDYESTLRLLALYSFAIHRKHTQSLVVASLLCNQIGAATLFGFIPINVPNRSLRMRQILCLRLIRRVTFLILTYSSQFSVPA